MLRLNNLTLQSYYVIMFRMDAYTFYKTKPRAEVLRVCEQAKVPFNYFKQIACGHNRPSVDYAHQLEAASNYEMTLRALLPHSSTMGKLQHKKRKPTTGTTST